MPRRNAFSPKEQAYKAPVPLQVKFDPPPLTGVSQALQARNPEEVEEKLSPGASGPSSRSLKNYQYSTEVQKFHQILAPVPAIILWSSLVFSRKNILPVLSFTGAAPPARQHQSW